MKIIRAERMGMCFGVRDALKATLDLKRAPEVTIHGELVHNEEVLSRLRAKGFRMVPEDRREDLPETGKVLVTAHGISDRRRAWLLEGGHELVDTTCPLVRTVHETARGLAAEGYTIVVLGKPGHVEVQGIIEDLENPHVVQSPLEVRRYPGDRIGVLCQTTLREEVARRLLEEIRANNAGKEIRFVDTICEPTKQRIRAVKDLVSRVDVLVVVGGKHSNNTRQLVMIGRRAGVPTHHVQEPADLDPRWFEGVERVGLTAGTSTLQETIDQVHDALDVLAREARGRVNP